MNKIKEMIKNVFNNNKILTARELIIFFVISFIFTIITLILYCDAIYKDICYSKELNHIIIYLIFYGLLYLPQIIVFFIDFLIKKFKIKNKVLLKVIYILISIFSCAYFLFWGWVIYELIIFHLESTGYINTTM